MTVETSGHDPLIGQTLGHYRVVDKIGSGGMGVVYLAQDQHLQRDVAIKVLPPGTLSDDSCRRRFRNEALALSRLNHPNIATIYDFDTQQDLDFLVMEYIPGVTLSDKLAAASLPEKQIIPLGIQLAEGLSAAHEHAVIHRDLKPGNLRLASDGRLKILDFGLAKLRMDAVANPATETITGTHAVAGTLAYMAPEQIVGGEVDPRTDIHAAGAVLYEMATGRRPFAKLDTGELVAAILRSSPAPPTSLNPKLSPELERIISKCLEKDPDSRYQSAKELAIDLRRLGTPSGASVLERTSRPRGLEESASVEKTKAYQPLTRPAVLIPVILVVATLTLLATYTIYHNRKTQWAREVALPHAKQLIVQGDWPEAYKLAAQAEKYIPHDPQLHEILADSAVLLSVTTDPPGASVFLKPYANSNDTWDSVGITPIKVCRISRGFKEYKITKPSFDTITGFTAGDQRLPPDQGVQLQLARTLVPLGTTPPEMVLVDAGNYSPTILYFRRLQRVDLGAFFIDKYETTNRLYQAFLDAGGYKDKKYWKLPFLHNGKSLSWEEAMALFTDKTGRNGPATWELAHFPEGQGDYPVSGISWYEAAAYAEFAGKLLPTVYHWNKAAGVYDLGETTTANVSMVQPVIMHSNFGDSGPAPVGKYRGVSPSGAYDMAGNVREWIWNGAPGGKYLLGGSWGTPEYLFFETAELLTPFDRSATNGFRCMKLFDNRPLPEATTADVPKSLPASDFLFNKPVNDTIFKIYASYYAYQKTPLNSLVEKTDSTSPYYVRQKVTFDAAYGGERVIAYVFLPKNSKPPYQSVIAFPGSGALEVNSIDAYSSINIGMFTRSGRALIFPVYKGTFERPRVDTSTPNLERDHQIMLYKDLARTLDYVETRPDMDTHRIGYFGLSWGAVLGPVFGALETRIRLFILEGGGLVQASLPEISPINFAPRHTAPTVIFNGRYDISFPVETSAKPLLRLLGTPQSDKALVLFDGGHVPPLDSKLEKQILDWLDRYLGKVQ